MSTIKQLKAVFNEDKRGYIPIGVLTKISSSNMLISDIARQHGYYPTYRRNSHTIDGYRHHSLMENNL